VGKNRRRYFTFEDRCEHNSKLGTLAADKIAEAVKRIDDYAAKAKALFNKSNEVYEAAPNVTEDRSDAERARQCRIYTDVLAELDRLTEQRHAWEAKVERLSAIPEVKAALLKREGRS